ncbi:MAG: hypothetical protein JWP81_4443 [Ferruginibacter sp.]|nr:hypothetical protein [Ferruginibacter sp.]
MEKSYLGTDTEPLLVPTSDEKLMAVLSHALTLACGFIAPLIIYLVKKDESSFITQHAKESLNFQITVLIVMICLFVTIIGILLMWIVGILSLALVIVASIKASEGKLYKYPFSLKLIR